MVEQGKYGYYPCNWETYRKLKALNIAYFNALKKMKKWQKWDRKAPQNRITREKLRNSAGEVVGYKAPVPMKEPEICDMFCKKIRRCNPPDKHHQFVVTMEELPIYEDYRKARYPVKTAEEVKPLTLSLEKIDKLYQSLDKI